LRKKVYVKNKESRNPETQLSSKAILSGFFGFWISGFFGFLDS
jgi:uncharacterized membrane protein YsdA (DUF1294 family)